MEDALPRSRPRRFTVFRILGGIVLLGAASLLLAFVIESQRVSSRLRRAIAEANRDDPHWRLEDLVAHRDVIPVGENASAIMAQIVADLPQGFPPTPERTPGMPGPQPSDLSKACDALYALPINRRLPAEIEGPLRVSLDGLAPALARARELAAFPRGGVPLELTLNPYETPLPETEHSRSVARFLFADAVIRASSGEADGAIESCAAIINAGRSIGDEPTLISQLVRIANVHMGLDACARVLGVCEPSDQALARLQALLEDELSRPMLLVAVKGERAMMHDALHKLETGRMSITALSESAPPNAGAKPVVLAPWGKLLYRANRAACLEWMNEAVRIAKMPLAAQLPYWEAFHARVEATGAKGIWKNWDQSLPLLLMPGLEPGQKAHFQKLADIGSMIALIAAERMRLKTGHWPDTLAAIDRSILAAPPIDPFSKGPILLLLRDGRLTAYSVGMNKVDDHGAFGPKPFRDGPYDIGWFAWDPELRRVKAAGADDETD